MGYCHCRSCRSWSGGPVNAFSLWKPESRARHLGSRACRDLRQDPDERTPVLREMRWAPDGQSSPARARRCVRGHAPDARLRSGRSRQLRRDACCRCGTACPSSRIFRRSSAVPATSSRNKPSTIRKSGATGFRRKHALRAGSSLCRRLMPLPIMVGILVAARLPQTLLGAKVGARASGRQRRRDPWARGPRGSIRPAPRRPRARSKARPRSIRPR